MPSVRQSKRTEEVLMLTATSGTSGGRTKAAPPKGEREREREVTH